MGSATGVCTWGLFTTVESSIATPFLVDVRSVSESVTRVFPSDCEDTNNPCTVYRPRIEVPAAEGHLQRSGGTGEIRKKGGHLVGVSRAHDGQRVCEFKSDGANKQFSAVPTVAGAPGNCGRDDRAAVRTPNGVGHGL